MLNSRTHSTGTEATLPNAAKVQNGRRHRRHAVLQVDCQCEDKSGKCSLLFRVKDTQKDLQTENLSARVEKTTSRAGS